MSVIDLIDRGELRFVIKPGNPDVNITYQNARNFEPELLSLARIGEAMEKFERLADPNRTSIMPVGNGQTGLYYAVCYDDETIMTGRTLIEVIDKYERLINLGLLREDGHA